LALGDDAKLIGAALFIGDRACECRVRLLS
jgi:hypothetical protein